MGTISLSEKSSHRRSGILLHITSLPGNKSTGQFGQQAYRFIDFLNACQYSIWQLLPLGPTHEDGSPYQSVSSFAFNHAFLDFTTLQQWRSFYELTSAQIHNLVSHPVKLYEFFIRHGTPVDKKAFIRFNQVHFSWLHEYALYCVLKSEFNQCSWNTWPARYKDKDEESLRLYSEQNHKKLMAIKLIQFFLYSAWKAIKAYANKSKILLFGDLPIFVAYDSADAWGHQHLFNLDKSGLPLTVAGVPPDSFSATGQRWGNPLYRWEMMKKDGFYWWRNRIKHHLRLYNMVRIDHFRGLEAYWEIPANETTAIHGRWQPASGESMLRTLKEDIPLLPIVAEDLGVITPGVESLRDKFGLPGMKVLQFAFDSDGNNPHLPHNHQVNSVVYTGTHDNDTTLGWFLNLDLNIRERCLAYLSYPREAMPWPMIRAALASVAEQAIIPMQDILCLGSEHRMNRPGTHNGNWQWRFQWQDISEDLPDKLSKLNRLYGRSHSS